MYADVVIDISHEKVDRPFQYRIPAHLAGLVEIGTPVTVPFGKGNTPRGGYVTGLSDTPSIGEEKIKELSGIAKEERSVDALRIKLAHWIRQRYGGTMIQALKTVLPAHRKSEKIKYEYVSLAADEAAARAYLEDCLRKNHKARARVVRALLEAPACTLPKNVVTGKLHANAGVLKAVAASGVIRITMTAAYRDPAQGSLRAGGGNPQHVKALTLSTEQARIVSEIVTGFDRGDYRTSLIHGVTGSGKTEVYIRLIEEMVARGRQAIVLIPEIALTYQTLLRFYSRFGDRVSVINSSLTPQERYDQLARAAEGLIDIMIGPRSALFTPFERLGLIVIDEEHETTYKSETMPKYHARETAVRLAQLVPEGALVVLGSATPSLEAYARAREGTYRLFPLTRRLTGGTLATVHVTDMRTELRNGNRSVFSETLKTMLRERLARKEQSMLFINRRGLAGFVSCRSCGHTLKCPHCDVSLAVHRGGFMMCHYCGYRMRTVKACPACSSPYISAFRAGTQQMEDEVRKLFPDARVLRMDADTTRTRHSYEKILSAFADGDADVLIGTQMIVKGHDFPMVTLVGALAADLSLNVTDFRAAERTFQLLTQAAGRAGRGVRRGDVVIQTYQPSHYAITAAAAQDYPAFFEEEMMYRTLLRYPPVAHLLAVQVFSGSEEAGEKTAGALKALVAETADEQTHITGPAPALVKKVDDRYRFVVYVKDGRPGMIEAVRSRCETYTPDAGIQIQFDTDPVRGF